MAEQEVTTMGRVSIGEYEAGSGTLDVGAFGGGIRLRVNGVTDFYFDADGQFTGTGNIVNPAWEDNPG